MEVYKKYLNEGSVNKAKIADILYNYQNKTYYEVIGHSGKQLLSISPVFINKDNEIDYGKSLRKYPPDSKYDLRYVDLSYPDYKTEFKWIGRKNKDFKIIK